MAEKLGQVALLIDLGRHQLESGEAEATFDRAKELVGEVQVALRAPPKPRSQR